VITGLDEGIKRRRVESEKTPPEPKRTPLEAESEPLGKIHLVDVPIPDVTADPPNGFEVPFVGEVALQRPDAQRGRNADGFSGNPLQGIGEPTGTALLEQGQGMQAALPAIMDQKATGQEQKDVRQPEIILHRLRQAFDLILEIVGEVTHGTPGERMGSQGKVQGQEGKNLVQNRQGIRIQRNLAGGSLEVHPPPLALENQERLPGSD